MNVSLSSFGSSLSSRLKGREVFNEIKSNLLLTNLIVLDFEGINLMTLSFGTELFDSINHHINGDVEVVNANESIVDIINFCRGNLKPIMA